MADLTIISLGAGTQSSALYVEACRGSYGQVDAAVFADTQQERRATYEWLRLLEGWGSIPILRRTAGDLFTETLRSIRETPSGFVPIPTFIEGGPAGRKKGRRQCTRQFKTEVVYKAARELLGLKSRQRTTKKVRILIGISTDEADRAKPSRYPILENAWPLLGIPFGTMMSRDECKSLLLAEFGRIPVRSSCVFCPLHGAIDWREVRGDPEAWARTVDFERKMRALKPNQFLHPSCVPIDQADLDGKGGNWSEECEGACGV